MAASGLHVWYISAEDDIDELHRRIAAHMQRHGITSEQIEGRFFVDDAMSFPLKIANSGRSGIAFDDATLVGFENAIIADSIDVIILDPFISFHNIAENDTAAMDALVKRLKEIAVRQKCNIELSHHVRKPPNTGLIEITVYDARGAGAMVNAVRSCRVLNQMSKEVAEQNGIEEKDRTRFIRIDNGKANMAPPQAAKWMELVNVEIANGDFVQALINYEMQALASGTTDEDKAWLRMVLTTGRFRASPQTEQWLGHAVANHFDRDVGKPADRHWINKNIKEWESRGWIKKKDLPDQTYQDRPHWVRGDRIDNEGEALRETIRNRPPPFLFQVLGPEPDHPCEQCGANGDVYLIRDPSDGVRSHALHHECAQFFFRRAPQ